MEKEGGNRERMRKCRESISLHFLIFSPFPPHFLIFSPFPRSPAARLQRFVQPCATVQMEQLNVFSFRILLSFEDVSHLCPIFFQHNNCMLIPWQVVQVSSLKQYLNLCCSQNLPSAPFEYQAIFQCYWSCLLQCYLLLLFVNHLLQ